MGIDLIKIKEIAKEKEDENWTFRTFLKRHDMPLEQMDSMVDGFVKSLFTGHCEERSDEAIS